MSHDCREISQEELDAIIAERDKLQEQVATLTKERDEARSDSARYRGALNEIAYGFPPILTLTEVETYARDTLKPTPTEGAKP